MTAEHTVVPHDEWVRAHKAFLAREKEFTRQRAALAQDRRDLPWEAVTKEYLFDGPAGKATLPDLFAGCRQGFSILIQNGPGQVFRTYSAYARGIDAVNGAYQFLDLVPQGWDEPAEGNPQFWVRRHDEYGR